VCDTTQVTERL